MYAFDHSRWPDLEIAAACELEERGSGHFCLVAGAADGGSFTVLGDVLGAGPPAVRAASFLRDCCFSLAASESDPGHLLEAANQALLERPPGLRELVSAVCVHYQPADASLSWALAGHPSPLLLPQLDPLEGRDRSGLLGLDRGLKLPTRRIELPAGRGVLAFTAETVDTAQAGQRLGPGGLAAIVAPHVGLAAPDLARRAHEDVVGWSEAVEPQEVCLLVLRRREATTA